jgi:hypothetical protein
MMSIRCFQIHVADNVATLLEDADAGAIASVVGPKPIEIAVVAAVARGHKLAVREIAEGEAVIKYGVRIGRATKLIQRGAWVHLHNLASDLDERSGTLDLHSGAPTDTSNAYV